MPQFGRPVLCSFQRLNCMLSWLDGRGGSLHQNNCKSLSKQSGLVYKAKVKSSPKSILLNGSASKLHVVRHRWARWEHTWDPFAIHQTDCSFKGAWWAISDGLLWFTNGIDICPCNPSEWHDALKCKFRFKKNRNKYKYMMDWSTISLTSVPDVYQDDVVRSNMHGWIKHD